MLQPLIWLLMFVVSTMNECKLFHVATAGYRAEIAPSIVASCVGICRSMMGCRSFNTPSDTTSASVARVADAIVSKCAFMMEGTQAYCALSSHCDDSGMMARTSAWLAIAGGQAEVSATLCCLPIIFGVRIDEMHSKTTTSAYVCLLSRSGVPSLAIFPVPVLLPDSLRIFSSLPSAGRLLIVLFSANVPWLQCHRDG